jgi:hypothetical protein
LDKYRERISEFCIEVAGCGFCGLVAKYDEFVRKLRLKRKARSKMSAYPNFVAV